MAEFMEEMQNYIDLITEDTVRRITENLATTLGNALETATILLNAIWIILVITIVTLIIRTWKIKKRIRALEEKLQRLESEEEG